MANVKIKFVGSDQLPEYHAGDPWSGGELSLLPGDEADVSAEKAAQLLEDFPGVFVKAGAKRAPAAKPSKTKPAAK